MSDQEQNHTPTPGTPEYEDAMAALGEAGTTEDVSEELQEESQEQQQEAQQDDSPAKAERPDWLPEKFWDAEKGAPMVDALAKSYAELEKQRGKPEEQAKEEPAGVDYEALGRKYIDEGKLDEGDYESLEKAGIPRALVDTYLEGQQALAASIVQSAYDAVGGEQEYNSMMQWARANKSEKELDRFDEQISKDRDTTLQAVKAMRADYISARGTPDKTIEGGGPVSGDVFQSAQEVVEAMSDPRYKKDPAYRAMIHRKLAKNDPFAADVYD